MAPVKRSSTTGTEGARGVTDTSAETLASIPNLIWLDVAQTQLTDDGLTTIAKPGRLRVLDLRQCTGVTDKSMKALQKLKGLRALGLESVPITDGGLKHLMKLKSLEALDLGMTQVTAGGVARLKGLKKLRWLSLNALPVGDKAVSWLKSSKTIEHIDIVDTQVTVSGLRALRGKTSLRALHLRGPMLDDEGLAIVSTLTGLRRLYLQNATQVTDDGLAGLEGLDQLEAFGISAAPQVTDAFLERLAKIKTLTWISLDRCTGLTKDGVAKLRMALPEAQVIDPWRLGIK